MAGFTAQQLQQADGMVKNTIDGLGNNTSLASVLAQMYGSGGTPEGTLAPSGNTGLTSHSVHTVPINPLTGNPAVQAINAEIPHAATQGNDATRLNTRLIDENPGAAYANPPANYGSTQQANPFGDIASLFTSPGSAFSATGWGHEAYPMGDPGVPTNVTADTGLFGVPARGFATTPLPPPGPIPHLYSAPPSPPPAPTPAPGTSFLQDRGVSTTNLNDAQVANALNAALAGNSHRGSFGV